MKLERKVYETRSQKVEDFALGVGLFIGLNIALWFILSLGFGMISSIVTNTANNGLQSLVGLLSMVAYSLPCLLQIGLFIYFGLTRYWIALGMLGAIAIGLLIVLLLGVGCFVLVALISGAYNQ